MAERLAPALEIAEHVFAASPLNMRGTRVVTGRATAQAIVGQDRDFACGGCDCFGLPAALPIAGRISLTPCHLALS